MRGSLSAKKIGGKTGRSAYVLLNNKRTYHHVVQRFVQTLCTMRSRPSWYRILLSYPVAWRALYELGKARSVGLHGTYFRSRRFTNEARVPTPDDLGPPPPGKQPEGRYSDGGGVVLYLSRTPRTAALEKDNVAGKPRIFIQEFRISMPARKFLRLAEDLERTAPVLQYLLIASEYLPDESSSAPFPYRATQFLAFLCKLRGIDAIEYPSVRAGYTEDRDAVNLVVLPAAVEAVKSMTYGVPFEYSVSRTGDKSAG